MRIGREHPNCRATGLGSTPHTDSAAAVDFLLETFPDVPFWPQLPRRTFHENMYVQFDQYLPGIRMEDGKERVWVELIPRLVESGFLPDDPDVIERITKQAPPAGGASE